MSSPNVNSHSILRFRWNENPYQHGNELPDGQYGDCKAIVNFVNEIIKKNPEKKFFAFEYDKNSRCCLLELKESVTNQGFKFGGADNEREIPKEVKNGYDYNDPALWHPSQSQLFVWKKSFEKCENQGIIGKIFSWIR